MKEDINYDVYVPNKKELIRYHSMVALGAFALGMVFYANIVLAMILGASTVFTRKFYIRYKIRERRDKLKNQFKDMLYAIDSAINSGRHMSEAIEEAYKSLGFMYDEKEYIMQELRNMSTKIKESQQSEEELLADFARRSKLEEALLFSESYATCRETGGNMSKVISKATEMLVDKLTIERDIQVITAQKKAEANIISSMPILIVVFLNIMSPGYLDKLYHSILGNIIMSLVILTLIGSYVLMNKIVEVRV